MRAGAQPPKTQLELEFLEKILEEQDEIEFADEGQLKVIKTRAMKKKEEYVQKLSECFNQANLELETIS